MAQTSPAEETRLVDSLLHTNFKRVVVGAFCGACSGVLLLALSTNKLWWIQLMASMCSGGQALSFDLTKSVLVSGLFVHFGFSVLNGLIFGKMTTSSKMSRLMGYGLVLGGLCWLASNMFAPDFLSVEALNGLAQWTRVFLFVTFGVSIGFFMSIASKALKV